jgi:hypothetical protein
VPNEPVFVNRTMQECARVCRKKFARWMTPAAWSGPENPRGRNLCGFCHTANFLEHGLIDKEHLRCCDEFRCYAE